MHLLARQTQMGKKQKIQTIKAYKNNHVTNQTNIDKQLRKFREIVNTHMRGQVLIGPGLTRLIKAIQDLFLQMCLHDFEQIIFPKLVSLQTWYTTAHIQKTLNQAYYVSRFRTRKPEQSPFLINKYKIDKHIPAKQISENLGNCVGGMTYDQCGHVWHYFHKRIVSTKHFPIKIYDRSGPSYGYQGKAIHSITRLDEFHRV